MSIQKLDIEAAAKKGLRNLKKNMFQIISLQQQIDQKSVHKLHIP